jgi:hypothetical protein
MEISSDPLLRIAQDQMVSLGADFALFSPSKDEVEKGFFIANNSIISFLKRAGLHDYSVKTKARSNKRNIPLLVITKNKIYKIKLSVFQETRENGIAAFSPMKDRASIEEGDLCAFISYFNHLILINYSKVAAKHAGKSLQRLGVSNIQKNNFDSVPSSVISDYEKLNFAINQHIKSEFYKEKELHLDFEDELIENVSKIAHISPEILKKVIISSAREKLNFDTSNPFSDLHSASLAWKRSGYAYNPPTTIFLSALSVIAEGMGADQDFGANNFYDRLLSAFHIQRPQWQQAIRQNFKSTVNIWEDFNSWLIRTDGRYGFATAHPIVKKWKYVSYGMSQAVVRTGDKKHLKNFLATRNINPIFDDLYSVIEAHLTSTAANKYLKIIWEQRHLRSKIVEAAKEQLEAIFFASSEEEKFSKLILRLQLKSFPYKSFQPSIIYRQENGFENQIVFDTKQENPAFKKNSEVTLSPIGEGVSVLGPPTSIAINNFLLGNMTLRSVGDKARSFFFRPQPAMALAEVEPSIFEQTNRPEVFKKYIILVQRKYQKSVTEFLNNCADSSFQVVENPRSISPKFVLFTNVIFVRSVSVDEMQSNNDPNYWIRPVETMAEIDIRDGIKLSRNIYHDNSMIELLVSTNEESFDLQLHIGEADKPFSKKIIAEDGIGSIKLNDFVQAQDFSGQDVKITIGLSNYKSTTVSFRSSENASYKFELQPAYYLGSDNYFGSLSVIEKIKLHNVISGYSAIGLTQIEESSQYQNIRTSNYSRNLSKANDAGEYNYFSNTDIQEIESCISRGHHHWISKISDGREGTCKDCGEKRSFPRRVRSTSRLNSNSSPKIQFKRNYNVLKPKGKYTALDILDSVFFLQDLSWLKFRELCSSISDDLLFANELLRNFATIGHVDIKLDKLTLKPQRIYASPPALIKVQDRYLLSGYSTKTLVETIEKLTGTKQYFEVGKMWTHLPIEIPSFDIRSVEKNLYQIGALVDQLNRRLSIVDGIGFQLISALPHLRKVYQNLPETSVAFHGLEKFNAVTGQWQYADSAHKDGGYRQIWPAHEYFIKTQGIFRKATFELTKLFAADLESMPLHNYSAENKEFTAKIGCELPTLYQRALVSFSGELPKKSDSGELIFKNVPNSAGSMLMNKIYGQIS